MQDWITSALLFIGPSYVSNAAPLLFGKGTPIDRGRNFVDSRPLFGAHKTLRGLIAGIIAGTVFGIIEYPFGAQMPLAGFLIGVGAVVGDLAGAFVKRRFNVKPGDPFPILDQLDFVFGALLLGSLVFPLSWMSVVLVLLVTPPIHLGTNYGAYVLRLKKTYW
ncbi:MAG TPA: CDP-2,3-bis-(O-geranylgeranyl)-sn-glycerol synthase [Candidatus Binatus sp.]|nr:CDP-2,3-bis-(O-geranylgeranyl)-sn-glycerol synthase [Candidatus Binatus sp.]